MQNLKQKLTHQKHDDGPQNSAAFFKQPIRPKITPTFPFTFSSNIRSPPWLWEDSILCTPDNFIRFDAHTNLDPDKTRRFEEIFRYIRSQLAVRKIKHFYHLAIDLSFCLEITSQDLRLLGTSIAKYFKSLRSLTLNVEIISAYQDGRLITNSDLLWFSNVITKSLKNLQEFTFTIKQNNRMAQTGYKQICRHISKRSKKLQSLHLTFHENQTQRFSPKFIKLVTHHPTTYLRNLRYYRLTLSGATYNQSPIDLKQLAFNRSRFLKNLEELELSIVSTSTSFGKTEKEMLCDAQKSSTKSRKLILHVTNFEPSTDNLSSMASCLFQHLKSLKALDLHISHGFFVDDLFNEIFKGISLCTPTLEHLKFYFRGTAMNLGPILANFACVPNNNIKTLDLQFFINRFVFSFNNLFNQNPLGSLYKNVIPQLPNLESLKLNFETRKGLTEEELSNLIASVATYLPKLEDFHLLFSQNQVITDEAVNLIIELCRTENSFLPHLKNILIGFSLCSEITEDAVRKLQASLRLSRPEIQSAVIFDDAKSDSSWHEPPEDLSDASRDDSDDSDVNLSDFMEESENNGSEV